MTTRTPLRDRINGRPRPTERPAPRIERPQPFVPVWLRHAREEGGLARDTTGLVLS
jgi:hypothetical protein